MRRCPSQSEPILTFRQPEPGGLAERAVAPGATEARESYQPLPPARGTCLQGLERVGGQVLGPLPVAEQTSLMRARSSVVALAASVVLVAAACSSGDDAQDSVELRPADEVIEAWERSESAVGAVGEPVTLDDGVLLTINSIEIDPRFAGRQHEPTHVVDLRVENPTGENVMAPGPELFCSGDLQGGAWYDRRSTYEPFAELPSESVREGVLYLSLHSDDGFPPDDCVDPVVRISSHTAPYLGQVEYPAPSLPE